MKNQLFMSALLAQLLTTRTWAQGLFQNLDFEDGNPPSRSPIPGWTASTGLIFYDAASVGGALVSVDDTGLALSWYTPLQGSFSVILFAGPDGPSGASSISQMGLVPLGTKSIQMDIKQQLGTGFTVTLGSQQIAMIPLQTFANYTVYGGDVSAEAGQSENLTITEFPPAPPTTPPSALVLDDIQFSSNIVPEPSVWSLMMVGGTILGALGLWRRR